MRYQGLLLSVCLVLLCVACGASSAAKPEAVAFTLNHPETVAQSGLRIDTKDIGCGGALTITNTAAQLSAQDQQALQQYVAAFNKAANFGTAIKLPEIALGSKSFKYTPWYEPQLPPIPTSVQWSPDGAMCFGHVQITNQRATPITIQSAGAQILSSQPNTFAYQRLDICAGQAQCPPALPATPPNCFYYVHIALDPAAQPQSKVDQAVKSNAAHDTYGHSCGLPLTVAPGEVGDVLVQLTSQTPNRFFDVAPRVTIQGQNGTETITLPTDLAWHLVFADTTHAPCYSLTGDHFTKIANPGAANQCL